MGAIEFQPEPLIYQLWWGQKTDKNRKNGNSTKINPLSIIYNKLKDKNLLNLINDLENILNHYN